MQPFSCLVDRKYFISCLRIFAAAYLIRLYYLDYSK
nr:MAG TPA: hypothetical protein [Bacteriophage sp.]DAO38596.1 MAG TPA: hypothetical protein [Caudoviricetes sp.]